MNDYSHRCLLMENIYNVQLFPDDSSSDGRECARVEVHHRLLI